MLKSKLVELYSNLNKVKELKGVKFAYGIIKNINLIKPEIEVLQKVMEPFADFIAYEKERIELAKKFAEKDKDGNPKIEGNHFVLADIKKFEKDFLKLQKQCEPAIEKRKEQEKEYEKLLKENIEINLHKIKMADVPQDISPEQLEGIFAVIEE